MANTWINNMTQGISLEFERTSISTHVQLKVMFFKSFKHFFQMLHVVLWNYAKNDIVHVPFSKIETY
jgi:hypothetical protein